MRGEGRKKRTETGENCQAWGFGPPLLSITGRDRKGLRGHFEMRRNRNFHRGVHSFSANNDRRKKLIVHNYSAYYNLCSNVKKISQVWLMSEQIAQMHRKTWKKRQISAKRHVVAVFSTTVVGIHLKACIASLSGIQAYNMQLLLTVWLRCFPLVM